MFKFLKEKLGNWAKNFAKEKEESEEIQEEDKIVKKERKDKKEKVKKKKEKIKNKEKTLGKTEKQEEQKQKEIEKRIEENIQEEVKEENFKKKSFFEKIGLVNRKVKISEKEFEKYKEELEFILLENNVALEVVDKILKELEEDISNKEIAIKEIENEIRNSLKKIIEEILIQGQDLLKEIKNKDKKPYVVLFCGINGSGKTTTIAKIANYLKENKISCVIAAGDTFRAASIEQLEKHAEKLNLKVIKHEYGADPAAVGFDTIKYAERNNIDCALIDTAGRMHTQKNLLREMEKIVKVCKPDKKIFVGESITGNDSVEQIKSFDEIIRIDGIILTKADIDEKGGTALSLGYITKKPIFYLGTGQEYKDIEPFDKKKFIEKLGL
ncbi:signal recognition particle-docking protein FtsY [Candidatus Woesearchaeota archaeon]|nr:signal recognition particle-docking protein FtsY [Candidatus Woesearchaeota archaeon]